MQFCLNRIINILIIIFSLLSNVNAQLDTQLYDLINHYRYMNGVNKLETSTILDTQSYNATKNMINEKMVKHSDINTRFSAEVVGANYSTPMSNDNLNPLMNIKKFKKFCEEYFDYTFNPDTVEDINYVVRILAIYSFYTSKKHKDILLNPELTQVGCYIEVVNDKIFFNNRTTNVEHHYVFNAYYAFNFR